MKKIYTFTQVGLISLALSACSTLTTKHSSKFSGQSAADTVLQADVEKVILKSLSLWHGSNCRKIEQIESKILSVQQTAQGDTKQIIESWQVTACNVSKTYQISLRPDVKGEVDFSVRLPPS
ncbi:hypothetical protein [Acinetobacter rudis]|uniref:Lipoprotein n=1 Tax=Acinetobacter rudis CIP 110305 TaxID=421052 RepID=S3NJ30_9GAMM|nr:hypothetical protein [Acinetobacter rudis]EPF74329.1 hypothetical protein F945_01696 [Acinetobacter rudis CIP 110305]